MVPGSTLMYGSSFCIRTLRPRRSRSIPIDALVRPFPKLLTTPPVTKMCFAMRILDGMPRNRPAKEGAFGGFPLTTPARHRLPKIAYVVPDQTDDFIVLGAAR